MLLPNRILSVVVLCAMLIGAVWAQTPMVGKIPVTTSSPEARALYMQGRALFESFKNVEARALFEQAVAKDPNFALAYRDLAQVRPSNKAFQEDMAKAASLVDKVSECERYWILADDAAGKLDLAKQREYIGRLVQSCGQDEHSQMELGFYYFGRQYYDSAQTAMQKATELNPGYVAAWNMLGYARRNLGDMSGAETAFRKYIELSPTDANAYDSYAELLLKEGKYDDAITQYHRALSVDTTFVISHFNVAGPYIYKGQHNDARHELDELLRRAPDDGMRQTAYFGMAVSYADEGKFDDAIASLERSAALMAKINDVVALSQNAATIGFLRLEQGKYDDAMTEYQRSVEIAGSADVAPRIKEFVARNLFYAKARIAAKKGQTTQASAFADSFSVRARASGTVDDLRAMHELYGIVALDGKQYSKAVEELKQGPAQNGYDLYRLALAYQGMGDKKKAAETMYAAAHINSIPAVNDVLMRQKAKQLAEAWAK